MEGFGKEAGMEAATGDATGKRFNAAKLTALLKPATSLKRATLLKRVTSHSRRASLHLAAIALAVLFTAPAAMGEDVNFPDPALEAAVRVRLGIAAPTPITDVDMQSLRWLSYSNYESTDIDITGLEYATNLEGLALYGNVSDLTPITGLGALTELTLHRSSIENISPIATLPNIKSLNFADNYQMNLSILPSLTTVSTLWLQDVPLDGLSLISSMTGLENLMLKRNQISEISPLTNLSSLSNLAVVGNPIADYSPLGEMNNLTALFVSDCATEDLAFVGELSNLTNLVLSNSTLDSTSLLQLPAQLESLSIQYSSVSNILFVSDMFNLTYFRMSDSEASDISPLIPLAEAGQLQNVILWNNTLNAEAYSEHIPQLQANGVLVIYHVPEPGTLLLISVVGAALLRHRKRRRLYS